MKVDNLSKINGGGGGCEEPWSKHEVLNRLKEHIDTKYQMPKRLELKGSKKSIESQQQNKDPQHDTEDPQGDPPEVILKIKMCPMVKI